MRVRLIAALAICVASACSYDFDQFARSAAASSGDAAVDGSEIQDGSIDAFDAENDLSVVDSAQERETSADTGQDVADVVVVEAAPPDAESDGPPVIACSAYQGVVYGGHCYYVVAKAADESTAELACPLPDSHLVTITSVEEQAAVTPLVSGAAKHWMGLSEQRSSYTQRNEANFRWTTGEGPYNPATSYRNWASSEPSFPTLGDCVVMRQTGEWASNVCNEQLPFVCERDF
jgi:hypothetical protein